MADVNRLKQRVSEEFEIKDMGAASRILEIDITRDRANGVLCLSHSCYLDKVLARFSMTDVKPSSTPIGTHFKLSAVENESECIDTTRHHIQVLLEA